MKHDVFAPDTLSAESESVTRPGQLEVQRPIAVVPYADRAPEPRRTHHPAEAELLRRLRRLARAD
jgi:hypothetical protein